MIYDSRYIDIQYYLKWREKLNEDLKKKTLSTPIIPNTSGRTYNYKNTFVLSCIASQRVRVGEIPSDLSSSSVPLSQIRVYSKYENKVLFDFTPPINDFKNANEIIEVGNDLYVTYYWNSSSEEKSKLVRFNNYKLDLVNKTIVYDSYDIINIGINTIHSMIFDNNNLYFSSRKEKKYAILPINENLNIQVYDLSSTAYLGNSDTCEVNNGILYLPSQTADGYSVIYEIDTKNSPTVIKEYWKGSVSPMIAPYIKKHKGYLYVTNSYYALDDYFDLFKIDLNDSSSVETLRVNLPTKADAHSFMFDYDNNVLYITTGRNPLLIKINLNQFIVEDVKIINSAQVNDPVPNGYYGSPETGYITDDNAFFDGFLYLGSELAKPGLIVLDVNTNKSDFFSTPVIPNLGYSLDIYGSIVIDARISY